MSAPVRALIRRAAEQVLSPPEAWIKEMHDAALGGVRMTAIAEDPVLADGTRRTNLANIMHWAASNVSRPGERVTANVTPEILDSVRDLVRRGLDESALDSFRTAQSVAWRLWMELCFELTDDAALLRELLAVTSLSISTFLDDTVATMTERMSTERDELVRGTHAQRRTTVALLLEGAPIPLSRAPRRNSAIDCPGCTPPQCCGPMAPTPPRNWNPLRPNCPGSPVGPVSRWWPVRRRGGCGYPVTSRRGPSPSIRRSGSRSAAAVPM